MEVLAIANKRYFQYTDITTGSAKYQNLLGIMPTDYEVLLNQELISALIQKKYYLVNENNTFGSYSSVLQEDTDLIWMKLQQESLQEIWDDKINDHWDEFLRNA